MLHPFAEVIVAALSLLMQERNEDNCWLRYKPGAWVKSKMTVEAPGHSSEDIQTLTLKEADGDSYVVEESYAKPGTETSQSRRGRGIKTGMETLSIGGKHYECVVALVKGTTPAGASEAKFWTPVGSRNAVKVVFKQPGVEGELMATSVDEKVSALGKNLVCNRLAGKIKIGAAEGTLRLLLCEDIPGGQVRADLFLNGNDGETKITFEALEISEKK